MACQTTVGLGGHSGPPPYGITKKNCFFLPMLLIFTEDCRIMLNKHTTQFRSFMQKMWTQ